MTASRTDRHPLATGLIGDRLILDQLIEDGRRTSILSGIFFYCLHQEIVSVTTGHACARMEGTNTRQVDSSFRNAVCSRAVRFVNALHGEQNSISVEAWQRAAPQEERIVERFVPVPAYRMSVELCVAGVIVGMLIAIVFRSIIS